jgi:hypothetical protein
MLTSYGGKSYSRVSCDPLGAAIVVPFHEPLESYDATERQFQKVVIMNNEKVRHDQ